MTRRTDFRPVSGPRLAVVLIMMMIPLARWVSFDLPAQSTALAAPNEPHQLADWHASGGQDYANFGQSVAMAGDVNADGHVDIIVGAPGASGDLKDEGRAYAFYGAPSGPSTSPAWTAEGDQANAGLGWSVAAAGDVNGDGFDDVIVGAPSPPSRTRSLHVSYSL